MFRVQSCCCGCKLRTGTLIILWLTVVVDALQVLKFLGGSAKSAGGSSMIGLRILELAVAAIALYGVYEKRPSFLLPFIGLSIFAIVIFVIILFLLIVASSLIINSGVIDQLINSMQQNETSNFSVDFHGNNGHIPSNSHHNADIAKAATTSLVIFTIISILFILAIESYFTIVVYSFYKQMIEEFKGTGTSGGIIYSTPTDQSAMVSGGGYPQQPIYPPSYGQQPGGVYPPLSEVKQ